MEHMHLFSRIVKGEKAALRAVSALTRRSAWFSFEPLPDDQFEIQAKAGEGLEKLLDVLDQSATMSADGIAGCGELAYDRLIADFENMPRIGPRLDRVRLEALAASEWLQQNASLVLAAEDLLEALQRIFDYQGALLTIPAGEAGYDDVQFAMAAIAKAEGKEAHSG